MVVVDTSLMPQVRTSCGVHAVTVTNADSDAECDGGSEIKRMHLIFLLVHPFPGFIRIFKKSKWAVELLGL